MPDTTEKKSCPNCDIRYIDITPEQADNMAAQLDMAITRADLTGDDFDIGLPAGSGSAIIPRFEGYITFEDGHMKIKNHFVHYLANIGDGVHYLDNIGDGVHYLDNIGDGAVDPWFAIINKYKVQ